jgi:hippurate hydrolase
MSGEFDAERLAAYAALRQHLHRRPELAYGEHETSALVAEKLRGWGFDVATGIGGTGVVASLVNGPGAGSIAIRADMDALPITEATGLPHASEVAGKMHACGHDGHTTILLAAAEELARTRDFSGTVRLIFQPAEEDGAGAQRMIDEGLFERFPVDAIYGLHNWPGVPAGAFRFIDGPAMAAVELIIIRVLGRGGHGAKPHLTVDPVVAAASIVMALQSVVSRNIDPSETAVVTVGAIHGGIAPNVIPDSVELQLTVRSFTPEIRDRIKARILAIAEAQAQSFGATTEIFAPPGYPALTNDPAHNAIARNTALRLFGPDRVAALPPLAVSEDFAYFLAHKPGAYLFVGNGASAELHSPAYDFNDAIIGDAARFWVGLVRDFLSGNAGPV